MEQKRFDQIVRAWHLQEAPSRRDALHLLGGAAIAALAGALHGTETAAKRKKKTTICLDGKTRKVAKKKARKLLRKGATKGACQGPEDCQNGTKPCGDTCIPNADCCTTADCDGTDICDDGDCVALRCGNGGPCTVFVSNTGVIGTTIGGLDGGDDFCQNVADGAGLSGTFKAWLSDGANSPLTRFTNRNDAGPYQVVPNEFFDGANPPPTVATSFADLTTCEAGSGECLQNPINRTEDGTVLGGNPGVWTGTNPNGTSAAATCNGWTPGPGTGQTGSATAKNDDWTGSLDAECGFSFPIYCFEQA